MPSSYNLGTTESSLLWSNLDLFGFLFCLSLGQWSSIGDQGVCEEILGLYDIERVQDDIEHGFVIALWHFHSL